MSFTAPFENSDRAAELRAIDQFLDENLQVVELVHADLVRDVDPGKGRFGMPAEQVLRLLILKQTQDLTYDDLVFYGNDFPVYRWFARLDYTQVLKKSSIQRNIKKIRAQTLEAISSQIVGYALKHGIEKCHKARTDCTGVETTIHAPSDSSLLNDCVQTLTRLLRESRRVVSTVQFCDHTRRAKRRAKGIAYARRNSKRKPLYQDLLKVTRKTVGYAERASLALKEDGSGKSRKLSDKLEYYIGLANRVIDQTTRRVIEGESVPVVDKLVSIHEPHTDIIVKDNRTPVYGHKVCLTSGASGLILDGLILDGNPADSTLAVQMVERLQSIYQRTPRQVAFDGAFCSKDNLEDIKALGVKDVAFSKRRGIEIEDMAKNKRAYRRLRNFRAGIEGTISFLKRALALDRCSWHGLESFKSYVWSAILSANLLTVARRLAA